MSFAPVTDHAEVALSQLLTQFRDKPKLQALLSAYVDEVQALEDAAWQVISESLDNAEGVRLDRWGAIVSRERKGLDDDEYRLVLKAWIRANRSDGTPEDVLAVLVLMLGADAEIALTEHYPASFVVDVGETTLADVVASLVARSRLGGVGAQVVYSESPADETFTFASGDTEEADPDLGWVPRTNPGTDAYCMVYGDRFVGVGGSGDAITSSDGETWDAHAGAALSTSYGIAWSPALGLYVAVGYNGAIATSPDGEAWAPQSGPKATHLWCAAWSDALGLFIAGGDTEFAADAYLITSPDGEAWTERSTHAGKVLNGMSAAGPLLVGVGDAGYLITSPDGATWTPQVHPSPFATLYDAAYGDGLHVATGTGGYIITSPDGAVWTQQVCPVAQELRGVDYLGGLWVIVSENGDVITSSDGETWTLVTTLADAVYAVAPGPDAWVAAGVGLAQYVPPAVLGWAPDDQSAGPVWADAEEA